MLNNLEIETKKKLKKQEDEGYTFFSEDNDRKRTYLIYSLELKRRLRELAFPFWFTIGSQSQAEYGVENTKTGDKIVYQTGKEEQPDKLVLISGEYSKAITDGNEELLKQQELERKQKEEAKQKRIDNLWKKEMQILGIPASAKVKKSYYCLRSDGEIIHEGFRIEEVIDQPLIQEINKEEAEKIENENSSCWHQVPPKTNILN